MSWAFYYFRCSLVNTFKKIFSSRTAIVIGCVILFGVLMGAGGALVDKLMHSGESETSVTEVVETEEEETPPLFQNPDLYPKVVMWVDIGMTLLILFSFGVGAFSSKNAGQGVFQMADVNMLFCAPIRPQSVMLFRVVAQVALLLFGMLYLLWQIPNLCLNLGLAVSAALMVLLMFMLMVAVSYLTNIFLYTLASDHEKCRKNLRPTLIGVLAVLVSVAVLLGIVMGKGMIGAMREMFTPHWTRWIPVLGWLKGIGMYAVEGNWVCAWICTALVLLAFPILAWFCWHIKADFYEDAIAGAEKRQTALAAMQESGKAFRVTSDDPKMQESESIAFKRGMGAGTFFFRPLAERKRTAKFGILTGYMLLFALLTIPLAIIFWKVDALNMFPVIPAVIMVILLFSASGNPIEEESNGVFFYLVPESSFKKCLYSVLAGSLNRAIDMLPAMAVSGVVMKVTPKTMIGYYAALICVDFFLASTSVLISAMFSDSIMSMIREMLVWFLRMLLILPIGAILLVGLLFHNMPMALTIGAIALLICGFGSVALSALRFENGK